MTGFKSKKAAALDEDGMYLVHQTASYADNLGKSIVALGKQTVKDIEQLKTQPAQEPVAFINAEQRKLEWAKPTSWHTPTVVNLPKIPLYTHPKRPWVDLTDEEISEIAINNPPMVHEFARAVLAKSKEKNND